MSTILRDMPRSKKVYEEGFYLCSSIRLTKQHILNLTISTLHQNVDPTGTHMTIVLLTIDNFSSRAGQIEHHQALECVQTPNELSSYSRVGATQTDCPTRADGASPADGAKPADGTTSRLTARHAC